MQSKKSFFNSTVFKKGIKQSWPLWGLASFVASLPVLTMLIRSASSNNQVTKVDIEELYYGFLSMGVPIVSFIYAIIAAMVVWNYLYSSKSVNFFHSIPVSRENLFFTQWSVGMFILLIPYVAGGIFTSLFCLFHKAFALKGSLILAVGVICINILFFGIATLLAHCTGNVLALPILYFIFNFITIIIESLVSVVGASFYRGVIYSYSGYLQFMCPVIQLFTHTGYNTSEYVNGHLTESPKFFGGWIIAAYTVAGIVLTIFALLIYRKRKSEKAGETIVIRVIKPIVHIAFTIVAALGGGYALAAIFVEFDTDDINAVLLTICMVVAGIIAYYILAMLIEGTIKVFNKKTLLQCACCSVGYILFGIICATDLCGIESYVPELENISTIAVSFEGYSFNIDPKNDRELAEQVLNLHKVFTENLDIMETDYAGSRNENYYYMEEAVDSGYDYSSREYVEHKDVYMRIEYELKSGRTACRVYNLYISEDEDYSLLEFKNEYMKLTDSREILRKIVYADTEYLPSSVWFSCGMYDDSYYKNDTLSGIEATKVYQGLLADIDAGNWTPLSFNGSNDDRYFYYNVELQKLEDDGVNSYISYDSIYVNITKKMTNSINALIETGVLSKEEVEFMLGDSTSNPIANLPHNN